MLFRDSNEHYILLTQGQHCAIHSRVYYGVTKHYVQVAEFWAQGLQVSGSHTPLIRLVSARHK